MAERFEHLGRLIEDSLGDQCRAMTKVLNQRFRALKDRARKWQPRPMPEGWKPT